VQNFQKFIATEARTNGLSHERPGEAVHLALSTAEPKAHYAAIPQHFKNCILPILLPARMLDAELAKQTSPTLMPRLGFCSPAPTRNRQQEKQLGSV
jgi:hypothetical protein